jgi:hypothetical protein
MIAHADSPPLPPNFQHPTLNRCSLGVGLAALGLLAGALDELAAAADAVVLRRAVAGVLRVGFFYCGFLG